MKILAPLLLLGLCSCFGGGPAQPEDPAAPHSLTPEEAASIGDVVKTVGSFFGPIGSLVAAAVAGGLGVYAGKKAIAKKGASATTTPPAPPTASP